MKNVLLINPPFNISKDNYDSSVSVGLLSIATYLDSRGVKVEMIDGVRQKNYLDLIKEKIKDFDIVGISVMTMQIANAIEVSRVIKEENPGCTIVWGGSHPTFFLEQTAAYPLVDIAVYGEGEETTYEIAAGVPLNDIQGIAFRQGEKVTINPHRPLHNPAAMPLFKWDLVPSEILNHLYLIPSLTSRGCPHQCTFCINAILKYCWRPRSAEQVLKDLEIIKNKECFKDKKLRFWDENFFVDINRAKKIIDGMLERNLVMPWETTVRANYLANGMVDDAFLEKLKKSGCYLLSFGAESGSPRILKKIKKGITPEEIVKSAQMCLRHGIIPQYSFMIGLPGEEKSDMMMTLFLIDRLLKLEGEVQILGPQAFRPYPGSELYNECLASGWKAPDSIDEWAKVARNELSYLAVKNFPWVKDKDFVESMEAYVRFGAHSIKSAMGSSIKAHKFLKLGFVLLCKLRWKLKFFAWPIEFKIAKKFVTK
ncbi:MAG: radical SAM protein [Patescibacteria group bacterium]|nr:radical SAM protein [Patescibacteria group bacterium]MDD4611080.1 radical SAM protein [Patescibacteria group bacterium]